MAQSPGRIALPRSQRAAPINAKDTGRTSPGQVLSISLIVRRKAPLDLAKLKGRRLSREDFEQKYGAVPADFERLRRFAHEHGLSVDEAASSLARRTLVVRGTVENLEKAFGVELHDYESEGRRLHCYSGSITMPEEHAGVVEAVLGLDARAVAKPHFRYLIKRAQAMAVSYSPVQVAALYGFPSDVNGAGETIGIVELGGGYRASDLSSYFAGLNLTVPMVVAVSVDGGTNAPTTPDSADGEVALDIEVAGAIAPGTKIAVYFAPNTDQGFIDAISTAVHDTTHTPSVISISWGGPESAWAKASLTALDDACQSAAALGVTITVASGDSGSSDGEVGENVDFPASSPHVLACGGTRLEGSGSSISSETVWNDGADGGATGGGVSEDFALPTWQKKAGVPPATDSGGGRGVPDVAGDASPETGYKVLVDGSEEVAGGTSAVAPLWAGLIALVNQKRGSVAGFVNPELYLNPGAFRDITSGNNGAFKAGPGWDACTGLGSPIGTAIAKDLGAKPKENRAVGKKRRRAA